MRMVKKKKKLLSKWEFTYSIVSLWVVTGLLIGAVLFMPNDLSLIDNMSRIAYGLVCLVTVWAGVYAWYRIKSYVDVIYREYVARCELEDKEVRLNEKAR